MAATGTIAPDKVREARHKGGAIESIQWLRCLAATLVVLYHVEVQLLRLDETHVNSFGVGASGVDLFFVITGFIMVLVTQNRSTTFGEFMLRRIFRIVPLYWLFTSVMLVILLAAPHLLNSTKFDFAHILSSFLFLSYPHPVLELQRPLLVVGWTLNYEMLFYVIYGAFLFLALPSRIAAVSAVLIGLVALWLVAGNGPSPIEFYGDPIILEFIGGMLVAYLYLRRETLSLPVIAAAALLGALLVAAGIYINVSEHTARFFYWGIAATMFLLAAIFVERQYGWPDVPLLRHLGDASYSIYLSHLFVLGAVKVVIDKLGIYPQLGITGTRVLMVVSALAAASAIYSFIERPLNELLAARRSRHAALLAK